MIARRSRTIKNATAFIESITARLNEITECYFEDAPTNVKFPYAVIGREIITDLESAESGDMITFDIDVYADEKKPGATVELLELCDNMQNSFSCDNILKKDGVFAAHLAIESQSAANESEADLCHKRMPFAARIFFIGG